MAMGRRRKGRQRELFVAASEIRALGNPFYRALNRLLDRNGFDEFAEEACREFYAEKRGRPGIPPGVYFRMLMGGVSGGDRLGAGDRVAVRGLDFAARVPGIRTLEEPAGAFRPVEDAQAAERRGARGGVRPGGGVAAVLGSSERQDAGCGRDDAGGERGDALDRAARRREGLRGVAGAGGGGVGDRDADAGGPCEAGPEASEEEDLEQGLGPSARSGGADREDEGRQHPHGAQVRAGGRSGDRGGVRGDGAVDGRRGHGPRSR